MPSSKAGNMEAPDYEPISVVDVYDIVTDFAKEFRPIIEIYGVDPLNNIMGKIVTILEHLEAQAVKIEKQATLIQERDNAIARLERDKIEKAADRQRFEKELEQIEENWREETHEMMSVVNRLQEENRKLLKALSAQQDPSADISEHPLSPEVDVAVLQRSRASIDKLREQLKSKDKDIALKSAETEALSDQVERLSGLIKELRKKLRLNQTQIRNMIDERADFLTQIHDQQVELNALKKHLGVAQKENEDLVHSTNGKKTSDIKVTDLDNPNKPRFTTEELKEILHERDALKGHIRELEDELELYRPKHGPHSCEEDEAHETDDEDAPVQGPLPYEPSDAPWKKSESGIRKLLRKLFNETNMSFLGNSPKRSLSTLSKMALVGGNTLDSSL